MTKLRFESIIREQINNFVLSDRRVVKNNFSADDNELTFELCFENFCVFIRYYNYKKLLGYNFLEDSYPSDCLYTEFNFPFSKIPYSIYDVHNAVNDSEFTVLNFHNINSEEYAEEAVNDVLSFVSRHIDKLNNCSDDFAEILDASFKHDLALVSKKIKYEDLENNPKLQKKHQENMYFFRNEQSYFVNFINYGKVSALQKWLVQKSSKNQLLTFEERYYDYLIENDFKIENDRLRQNLKQSHSETKIIYLFNIITTIITIFIGFGLSFCCELISKELFYKDYTIYSSFYYWSSIIAVIMAVGFSFVISPAVKRIFFRHKNIASSYDDIIIKNKKIIIPCVVLVILCMICQTVLSSKCLAIGENDMYFCESAGKPRYVEYSDAKFYDIDGWYDEYDEFHDDKQIVVVIDDKYDEFIENSEYKISYDEMKKIVENKASISGKYKSVIEFQTEYCK
ncbi:MAG: hypothetical protein NC213_05125 [Acetobacter sp.]|nr:hypothetical protein [Bacteroides sp.]MCM1341107.1 hypothetical protein [Acetobacter sp.]MCM1433559.1 hypothetical protein [Clostridiales bacterium]